MLLLAPTMVVAALVPVDVGGADTSPWPRTAFAAAMVENPAPLILPRPEPQLPVGVRAAELARRFVGVPYRWGGASPGSGFDCSGLVYYVYGQFGIDVPHNAAAAFGVGRAISLAQIRPGDLLFYRGLGHMGMYLGEGRWIHAPRSGQTVRIDAITVRTDFVGARRLVTT